MSGRKGEGETLCNPVVKKLRAQSLELRANLVYNTVRQHDSTTN
jgi:hypothetical protein